MALPSFASVVINTNGRALSLAKTLAALSFQTYRHFEVCVVAGPQRDGTHELIAHHTAAQRIKSATCRVANLSQSRNIGIRLAAGDLVAFIDDDAIPEPVWLERLVEAFEDATVTAAGGPVFAPDSRTHQFRFGVCDRHGDADHTMVEPADAYAVPYTRQFPHAMGTNCMFRREALVRIGGFDEEYEYYLDETDVCCRLIDAGGALRQIAGAPVHHKFLAGTVRNAAREETRHYPIVKNRIYFALINGTGHDSLSEKLARALQFVDKRRQGVRAAIAAGRTSSQAMDAFDAEVDDAWRVGLSRGLAGIRRCPRPETFTAPPPFLPFQPTLVGQGRRVPHAVVLLPDRRQDLPAFVGAMQAAESHRASGAFVRVVSFVSGPSAEVEGVDLSDSGVWLERIVADAPRLATAHLHVGLELDETARQRALVFAALIQRIDACHRIDVIEDWSTKADSVALVRAGDARVRIANAPRDVSDDSRGPPPSKQSPKDGPRAGLGLRPTATVAAN